jgi:hypothetical protein
MSRKKLKILLIAIGCMSLAPVCMAQNKSIASSALNGKWVLESIVLYKYDGEDSAVITNDFLPKTPYISGVFDTIYFKDELCRINMDSNSFDLSYRFDGENLDIMLLAVPHSYTVAKDKELLILYRKYDIPDDENNTVVFYGVKLMYHSR